MRETWIDSLKGLSILAIILTHSGFYDLPTKWGQLFSAGQNFVAVFFILSAFLSFKSFGSFTSEGHTSIQWIFKRFILLSPVYFLAPLIGIALGGAPFWLGKEGHITTWNVFAHLFYLSGLFPHYCNSILGVEWYIGVLALFYLLVPFFFKYINTLEKALLAFLFASIVSSIFSSTISSHLPSQDPHILSSFTYKFCFICQLPTLLLGVLLYHFSTRFKLHEKRRIAYLSISLIIIATLLVYGCIIDHNYIYKIPKNTLYGTGFLCFILFCFIYHPRFIENQALAFFGKLSLPIYLFHYFIIHLYDRIVTWNTGVQWVDLLLKYFFVISITTFISILIHHAIQKPLTACYRKRFY